MAGGHPVGWYKHTISASSEVLLVSQGHSWCHNVLAGAPLVVLRAALVGHLDRRKEAGVTELDQKPSASHPTPCNSACRLPPHPPVFSKTPSLGSCVDHRT